MSVKGNLQTESREGEETQEPRMITTKSLLDRISTELKC